MKSHDAEQQEQPQQMQQPEAEQSLAAGGASPAMLVLRH